ncbi:MAG: RNA degradosome polyphosphate kinase [Actinomycetaceae bacterium]|nr:RNA degradosome polyphosphate kinase [Actinomycetaceae bacterium]
MDESQNSEMLEVEPLTEDPGVTHVLGGDGAGLIGAAEEHTFESATPDDFFKIPAGHDDFVGHEYEDSDFEVDTDDVPDSVPGETQTLPSGDTTVPEEYLAQHDPSEDIVYDDRETDGSAVYLHDAPWDNPPSPRLEDHPPIELEWPEGLDHDGLPKLPKGRWQDRELSWLAFNQRVFEQAQNPELELLERLWFLTIFASNLDEFYMVRVAGLKRRIAAGIAKPTASGLSPRQLLDQITEKAQDLMSQVHRYFHEEIRPQLDENGLKLVHFSQLSEAEKEKLHAYFRLQIFPVLSPLAVDPSHPFPYISGLSLNLAVIVRNPHSGKEHFARVKVPSILPSIIPVSDEGVLLKPEEKINAGQSVHFVPLVDVIAAHLDHLFPGMEIVEAHAFRVTRNEDLEVEEDDAESILTAMEEELLRRRFGPAVRLEVTEGMSTHVLDFLVRNLGIKESDVVRLPAPLDMRGLNDLHELDLPKLRYRPYVPVTAQGLAEVESSKPVDIFTSIRNGDVLLHHPYDSFSTSVQQLLVQAAHDPRVLAIKQTLYRTSGDSPIVQALMDAAEAGKQVVAIVEIKARFDEEANISWARKLEQVGVHVVYGMVGLKTHCKLCLIVRQEADGLRRYCHVGTGNYHPKTARGYEDLGLLTCDPEVAQDLTRLFNQLSGYAPRTTFHRLLVAPRSIRDGLVERIEREVENHRLGKEAWIRLKFNSIIDEGISDALYRASQAGVPVDVQVRGICSLRSGIPGLSENMRVHSILGRFLEHSRIFCFANDGDPDVWIGSADLMHRNLDRRVEALIKIIDPRQVSLLVDLVTKGVADTTASWRLMPDGEWVRFLNDAEGQPLEDIQETLMARASSRVSGRDLH